MNSFKARGSISIYNSGTNAAVTMDDVVFFIENETITIYPNFSKVYSGNYCLILNEVSTFKEWSSVLYDCREVVDEHKFIIQ